MSTRKLSFLVALVLACSAHGLTVNIQVLHHSPCGQGYGSMQAIVEGGTPPYSIQWSNGPTTEQNFGLVPGTYTVTVTDALLDEASDQADIISLPNHVVTSAYTNGGWCFGEWPYVSFYAGTENGLPPDPASGTFHTPGPYSFDAVGFAENWAELPDACTWFSYYIVSIDAPMGTDVTVNFADGAGCPGSFTITIPPEIAFPTMQVVDVAGSCSNGAIGAATISVAPSDTELRLHLRNASGAYVPDECSAYWVTPGAAFTHTFANLAPGTYHAVLDFDLFNQFANGTFCTDSVELIIPDLGTTCGLVSGRLYVDNNASCTLNGGENLVPATVIEITPGPQYIMTNGSGQYSVDLPYGTYTFTEQHPVLEQGCPLQVTLGSPQSSNNNIGCLPGAPLDVQLTMTNGPARPGFELHYGINVDNLTPSPTGVVTLTMEFDPVLNYINAIPAPTTITGNILTWTAPFFTMTNAFQHNEAGIRFQVPPDIGLVGTTLNTTATITTENTDVDLGNNTVLSAQLVTASLDPNDKTAVTSGHSEPGFYDIGTDAWIDYTIRFQNTGTDTAFNVVITDTLPSTLDPATVQWGPASHGCTRSLTDQGIVKFVFTNILLPDSNVNETASHGFASFRIRPVQPVLAGTVIENIANIFFDFNPPVITEPSVLVAEFSTGVVHREINTALHVFPNPANDAVTISTGDEHLVRWALFASDARMVRSGRLEQGAPRVDLAGLAPGTYIIQTESLNGTRQQTIVIKH